MRRIVILGNAGSGKSTLARIIGQRLGLPVIHLDALFWRARWTKPELAAFRQRVETAVSEPGWVCEGNYHRQTFDLRLPAADLVVWLDTPPIVCLKRVIFRSLSTKPRPDLPAGCSEHFDADYLSFLRYIWRFDRDSRPAIEAARLRYGPRVPVVRLRGSREASEFVAALQP